MHLFLLAGWISTVGAVIKGLSIYGLETERKDFICSWKHPVSWYVDQWALLGGNSIRVPFSYELLLDNSCWKLDQMFDAVEKHPDMTILLDYHRTWGSHQGPVPTEGITIEQFIEAWVHILTKYEHRASLIGAALFNEYQGADSGYWNGIMRGVITKLEDHFPGRFVWVVGGTNWGGNLAGIDLEDLAYSDVSIADRIRYDVHKYIFSGSSVPSDWDISFGSHPDKVIVGEWGFKTQDYAQVKWAETFVDYLIKRNIRDSYFWTVAHSGDTNGIWFDDCETLDQMKYQLVKRLWDG